MAKFKMIEDEAQLELPEYIDEPRYVRNKAAGYGLFFLGWLAWIWLFLPLITMLLWLFQGYTVYEQLFVISAPQSSFSLFYLGLAIMVFILILLIWAVYNWLRFRDNERRAFPEHIQTEQLAESFQVDTTEMAYLQQAKNLTLHYDQDGQLEKFEVHQPLSSS
ncbi:poly-beta-1,6-N-acetyl-D-glucosamine biosynthesis protein PgaD [Acinetobacter indicus]|uniref:poly-beta-1,6-N-acetyl-D-glucosamine biosynthesis protein PgaD n=1 Tax=Acinetobacter indicus TaxID=756892 RepID=UPI002578E01F|nr:poly-beta-1,6-N-acetyl-D-glucosamine biosynthesis protein PgaD [Acinetobacter indicus]MDM1329257.1 poly-beta-1,6-N-acetyl-D-glucosamine biosynthesis protein PgaD [Acinetobacter indicus]MDM1338577.1 poly-beta-1,6-N-acetyl-D-glucosamine biosynthesis protein PgaD [Acinetobacter indicus]